MTKSSRYSSAGSPPPRPVKSNLRNMTAEKLLNAANTVRRPGRFTEHFDQLPPQELLDIISDHDDKIQATTRQRTISTTTMKSTSDSDSYFPPLQRPLSRKLSAASRRSMTPSLSTPPSPSHTLSTASLTRGRQQRQKRTASLYRRRSSTLASTVAHKFPHLFNLNRASVIITRLEQWLQLIKCIIQWLDETAKLHLQMSRGYSHRHLPLFQMELQPDQTPAASTLYAGLRLLTSHVADGHHLFGGHLQQHTIPALLTFKRECKEKIKVLRNDQRLGMDELLRRAEQTKKSMDLLNKVCLGSSSHQSKSTVSDPWLANLYVLRQLKREVNEENRLRQLMVPIQKETADFEARLLGTLKPAIQYCCEFLAPGVWDGSADEETAPFELLMDRIVPQHEWQHFYDREEKELVDENHVDKDYLNINYPNKRHDKVVTLKKATMQRYLGGVRARFSDRLYVLSQGGYLHQFRMDDKVVPERSIYIPDASITALDDCTFEITRTGSDGHKKVYVIKANSMEEMQSWCQLLSDMASGKLAIRRPRKFMHIVQGSSTDSLESPSRLDSPLPIDLIQSTDDVSLSSSDHHTSLNDQNVALNAPDGNTPISSSDINSSNNDNHDDSTSSDGDSVTTVTKRYSLLPTTSNHQCQQNDDDAASSIYDDAASHLSASTHYDDAASSLYLSTATITSSPSSSRRSSMDFEGYHDNILIANLEN
ncbi:hypothetical protein BC941DRAFT_430768 [Chlamydoabsidia padenii]|nr:hypothetical protein BC941DRAFT_430768 [Chlamydoabsidia padenii]